MRLPDFIIIGAAKLGTTTLYNYLSLHPQICMSPVRETEFFAKDEKYIKGLEWYGSFFSNASPHQVCGEKSVTYTIVSKFPEAVPRIAQVLPNVKLIYIMRHPVDKAYAFYGQPIKNDQCKKIN